MGYRYCLLLIAMVFAAQKTTPPQAADRYIHPGTIVDAVTGNGIQAGAYAYGSREQVADGNCPRFKEDLDGQQSEVGTGVFKFHIDNTRASYVAVYCQNGYGARTEDKNDNSLDGSRVQPDPILLSPKQSKLASLGIDPIDASYVAIGRVLDRAQSDVLYLSKADEGSFYKALSRFPEQDQRTVSMLHARNSTGVLIKPLRTLIKQKPASSPSK